jgi:hypothetical protein
MLGDSRALPGVGARSAHSRAEPSRRSRLAEVGRLPDTGRAARRDASGGCGTAWVSSWEKSSEEERPCPRRERRALSVPVSVDAASDPRSEAAEAAVAVAAARRGAR